MVTAVASLQRGPSTFTSEERDRLPESAGDRLSTILNGRDPLKHEDIAFLIKFVEAKGINIYPRADLYERIAAELTVIAEKKIRSPEDLAQVAMLKGLQEALKEGSNIPVAVPPDSFLIKSDQSGIRPFRPTEPVRPDSSRMMPGEVDWSGFDSSRGEDYASRVQAQSKAPVHLVRKVTLGSRN